MLLKEKLKEGTDEALKAYVNGFITEEELEEKLKLLKISEIQKDSKKMK